MVQSNNSSESNIFLNGEITETVAEKIVYKLLELDSKNNKSPINFFINSPGGSVTSGLAILDTLQYILPHTEVSTICNGFVSGLSTLILASGSKGLRFSYPNSKISLCELSYKDRALETKTENLHAVKRIKAEIYAKLLEKTNQNLERIKEDSKYWSSNGDNFLTPPEAIHYGIIDEIIND